MVPFLSKRSMLEADLQEVIQNRSRLDQQWHKFVLERRQIPRLKQMFLWGSYRRQERKHQDDVLFLKRRQAELERQLNVLSYSHAKAIVEVVFSHVSTQEYGELCYIDMAWRYLSQLKDAITHAKLSAIHAKQAGYDANALAVDLAALRKCIMTLRDESSASQLATVWFTTDRISMMFELLVTWCDDAKKNPAQWWGKDKWTELESLLKSSLADVAGAEAEKKHTASVLKCKHVQKIYPELQSIGIQLPLDVCLDAAKEFNVCHVSSARSEPRALNSA